VWNGSAVAIVTMKTKTKTETEMRNDNPTTKNSKKTKEMRNTVLWMFTAILTICSTSIITISCEKANADNATLPKVESTELIRTSQSWDGVELPDYFEGRPELVAVKYVFPAGQKLGWHHHPVMNYGILVQGELTIIDLEGNEKVVKEGEVVVEMVNTIHHGENRGTKPVILYMFYLSQEGKELAVQHPEIHLE
jgi:quercetin dioxygenase-like cupin family protein